MEEKQFNELVDIKVICNDLGVGAAFVPGERGNLKTAAVRIDLGDAPATVRTVKAARALLEKHGYSVPGAQ
jgi:hypothetical protein